MSDKFKINPFTGKLDNSGTDQISKIVTHERTIAGNLAQVFDKVLGIHLDAGPLVVVDNNGNVVRSN